MRTRLRERLQKRMRNFLWWYRRGETVRLAWLLSRDTL